MTAFATCNKCGNEQLAFVLRDGLCYACRGEPTTWHYGRDDGTVPDS